MKQRTRLAETAALLAIGLAALALWSWGAGVGDLFASGSEYVPMAPSTALLMLLASLAVYVGARWSGRASALRFGLGVAGLAGLVGLLASVRPWFGWASPVEEWLAHTTERVAGIPMGQMSPLTGITFVAAAVALFAQWLPNGTRPARRRCALLAGVIVLLIGAGATAGYVTGKPWLYDTSLIPMALWTAVAFALLGLALVILNRMERRTGTGDATISVRSPNPAPVVVFAFVTLLIGTLSALYLRNLQDRDRDGANKMLDAVAELKASQIAQWRLERLRDAQFFARANFAGRDVQTFLADPTSEAPRKELLNWLTLLKAGDRYARITLFDTNLVARLSVPEQPDTVTFGHRELMANAMRTGQIMLTDVHRGMNTNDVQLSIILPVSSSDGTSSPGVLLLNIDPRKFLNPLVQSLPTPSPTTEVLLVRREGEDLVCLNSLRHDTNMMLFQWKIASEARLSATLAAVKGAGPVEGEDYRGISVLATSRPVPDSPWFVVVKTDREEIQAPQRHQAGLMLALALGLTSAAGLLIWLLWKQRETNLAKRELATERERRALAERVEHVMKNANDMILLTDAEGRILEANDRVTDSLGYSLAELQGMKLIDLHTARSRSDAEEHRANVQSKGSDRFETVIQRKDRSTFPIEASGRMVEIDNRQYYLGIAHDITERKAQEREIERLTRYYAALSQVNQSIIRIKSREELFQEVCRIAVELAGFKLVWVGWPDQETHQLKPVAHAGDLQGYLDVVEAHSSDHRDVLGRAGGFLREGKPHILNDIAGIPGAGAWHEAAAAHGLKAVAVLPIWAETSVCGVIAAYTEESGVFQTREIALLEEMATDVSFALAHLDHEARQKRAELALRESEEQYRSLVGASPDAIAVTDPYGAIVYASPRSLEMFGAASEEEFVGHSVLDWVAAVDLEKARENFQCFLTEGRLRDTEYALRRKDGTQFTGEISVATLRFGDGTLKGMIIITRDISERRRAEEDLKRLATAVEQANEGIVITDSGGSILYVNPAFEKITGYTREEALGKNPRIVKSGKHEDAFYQQMWRTLTSGEVWSGRITNKRKDGTLFEEVATISPVRNAAGKIVNYVAVKRDVTHEVALESQLRQAQKMEAIGQLAGGVAHDFNNILAATMLQLALLQQKPGLNLDWEQALKELMAHTERAASLTRQLLLFSRRSVMHVKPLDVNEVIEALLKMLRRLIGEDIALDWQARSQLPPVMGDPGMMDQVVMNLVVNARDAMPEGGRISLATDTVEVDAVQVQQNPDARPGRFVRLSVADTGSGMDEATLARIFEPFFTTKAAGKGTGLGLATVYGIVQQHKGWITVASEPGKGSTFHVFLPASTNPANDSPSAPTTQPLHGGHETILLAEDDEAVRQMAGAFLRRRGYQVLEANNGVEAVKLWKHHQGNVDLLLTDMVMPGGITGLQLAQQLRHSKPGLKVIITSGYSTELVDRGGMDDGMLYVSKPCMPADLAAAVRRALDQRTQ